MGCIYRCFDEDGNSLYLGCTEAGMQRFKSHRLEQPWWREVASITVEHIEGRRETFLAECAAIKAERPRFNKQGLNPNQRTALYL